MILDKQKFPELPNNLDKQKLEISDMALLVSLDNLIKDHVEVYSSVCKTRQSLVKFIEDRMNEQC